MAKVSQGGLGLSQTCWSIRVWLTAFLLANWVAGLCLERGGGGDTMRVNDKYLIQEETLKTNQLHLVGMMIHTAE